MPLDGLMLWVPDVPATVKFYQDAFDLQPRWVREEGDYAQMETGGVTLQFAAASAAESTGIDVVIVRPDTTAPGMQLALSASDVPAAMRKAIAAGGSEVVAPVTKPWGQVVGYVRDLNGFVIEVATPGDRT